MAMSRLRTLSYHFGRVSEKEMRFGLTAPHRIKYIFGDNSTV